MKTAENKQKVFEELSLYDPFMFAKVLNDPEKCRGLFERVIGEPVKSVTGVQSRYDGTTEAVLAFQAESETDQYSVCVRHIKHGNVGAAGAHAMAMAENLCRGKKVQPQIVGIVITPFDPFGKMRGKYTLSYYDREADCGLSGGPRQIILSTVGRGEDKSLQNFLDYMAGRALVYHDDYIVSLMNAVKAVRANPFWAAEYHDLARLRDTALRDGRVEMLKSALKKGAKAEYIKNFLGATDEELEMATAEQPGDCERPKAKRLFNLHNTNKPVYAVAYGENLQDAVKRTCDEINLHKRGESTVPDEWDGEEFNIDTHHGVLIFD